MDYEKPDKNKNKILSLAETYNSFSAVVSDLDTSYNDLKSSINELSVKISEKNKSLEKKLGEVYKIRCFFDSILNSMRDGVIVVDVQGEIVLLNESIKKLTGYSDSEVIGKSYQEIFGNKVSERFSPIYSLVHNIPLIMEEKEILTKSGIKIPVRYSTSLLYNSEEEVIGVVEVCSDLTKSKKFEVQIQMMKIQSALNQMAGLVAHEVRNPLAGIKGCIDLLAESFDSSDTHSEKINEIYSLIKEIDNIIVNFLTMAQPIKPNIVKTDFIELINDVLKYFNSENSLQEKSISLDVSFPKHMDSLLIHIDPILIKQALVMILDNAVKSMHNGGKLQVKIEIHCTYEENKEEVAITISDTGCGMSKDELKKIFDPFFTTRDRGMGLGLSLAKNFIKFHEGDIFVESIKGVGTTVSMILFKNYEV